jgi:hypothetical protein
MQELPLEVCEPDVLLLPFGLSAYKPHALSHDLQERTANVTEIFFICRAHDRSSALLAISGQLWIPPLLDVTADVAQGFWNFQSTMQASHLKPPLIRRGPEFLARRRCLPPYPVQSKAISQSIFQFTRGSPQGCPLNLRARSAFRMRSVARATAASRVETPLPRDFSITSAVFLRSFSSMLANAALSLPP